MCVPAEGAVQAHVTVSALHDHLAHAVRLDAELTLNPVSAGCHKPHVKRRRVCLTEGDEEMLSTKGDEQFRPQNLSYE